MKRSRPRLIRGIRSVHVLDITVSADTSAPPEQVLAAATDFSKERVKVWSNSKPKYFQMHDHGTDFAEVTGVVTSGSTRHR